MRAPFLVAREAAGGPIRGVLPLFVVRRPFGAYLTSGMFGAYGRNPGGWAAFGQALVREAQRLTRQERPIT